ncbi:MAG: hypothetical protein M3115_08255 [Thermoproteota archaeon]|nr:hypothetical protein [Thermoproteota archaeon]
MSPRNKQHTMEALANLSKFQGRYHIWMQIRQRYNLKWTSGNESIKSLERFFNPEMDLDRMIWIVKEMMRILPGHMSAVIKFALLTGLRPSEACESVRLLNGFHNSGPLQYYNPEEQMLEHFKFPEIFLRATKKAFISYLSRDNYQHIVKLGPKTPTWNGIRLACRRRNINMEMRFCRKIFASHLRVSGIQPEIVNLLQGRVNSDILTRHYLVPQNSLKDQVLDAVRDLQKLIDD